MAATSGALPPFGRRRVIRSGGLVSVGRGAVVVVGHQRRVVVRMMVMVVVVQVGQIMVAVVDGRRLDGRCGGSGIHVPAQSKS